MERKGDGGEEEELLLAREDMAVGVAPYRIFLIAAIGLGICYAAFVGYIAVMHTDTWLEKLRLLPLLIVALTVPLLGAVMIRMKHHLDPMVGKS